MRKLLLATLTTVVVLVIFATVILPMLMDKDKVLALAAREINQQTGATLTVDGEASLSLFPVMGVSLGDVSLAMPEEKQPGLRVETVQIGVQVLPLLKGNVQIDTIRLVGLSARLVSAPEEPHADTSHLSDKQLDAFYAKRRQDTASAGQNAGAEAILAVPMALNVQQLTVRDARVEIVDPATGESTTIELPHLEISGLNLDGRPIPLSLQMNLPGKQPIAIDLNGSLRVDQQAQNVNLDELNVAISGATAKPLKLTSKGVIDLSRQIANLQLQVATGDTRGDGTLRYASFESPQIDTKLHLNRLDPALLVLAGPNAAASTDTDAAAGRDQPLPLDAIRQIDTRAELTVDEAVFDVHTIHNLHAQLRALEGVIDIPVMTGTLHGGKLDAKATFDGKHNVANLNSSGGVSGLDLAAALAAMQSKPVMVGTASLDWKIQGGGRTADELVNSLAGPVHLTSDKVTLKGVPVQKMLCQGVALVNKEQLSASFPADSPFDALDASLQLADGALRLNPLRASLAGISLTGTGVMDLSGDAFKSTFTARLSPQMEKLDPACRVSKRLLAIDWPVQCKGQLSADPAGWCRVDTQEIIADLAKYEVQKQVQKKAGKLLNKFFK